MFHIHILKEYLNLCNKTNKRTCIASLNRCAFVVLLHTFPMCYCTKRLSPVFTSDSYPEQDKSSPTSHLICVRHILILSSHLCSGLTNGLTLRCQMPCPSHPSFSSSYSICYKVQLMKLFDIQFSPSAYYQFLPLRSRYSCQNPHPKHPQHISPIF